MSTFLNALDVPLRPRSPWIFLHPWNLTTSAPRNWSSRAPPCLGPLRPRSITGVPLPWRIASARSSDPFEDLRNPNGEPPLWPRELKFRGFSMGTTYQEMGLGVKMVKIQVPREAQRSRSSCWSSPRSQRIFCGWPDDPKVLVFCWFWHPRLTPDPCDKLACSGRLMQVLNQRTSRGFKDENMLIGEIISTLSSWGIKISHPLWAVRWLRDINSGQTSRQRRCLKWKPCLSVPPSLWSWLQMRLRFWDCSKAWGIFHWRFTSWMMTKFSRFPWGFWPLLGTGPSSMGFRGTSWSERKKWK